MTQKVYQSKKSGPFIVTDITNGVYTVEFQNTGTVIKTGAQAVYLKSARDPYARTVHGIGMIGEGQYTPTVTSDTGSRIKSPAYRLWVNMLARCYVDPANGKRPTYMTCKVNKQWHNFQTFCNDIKQLDGYGSWLAYQSGLGGEIIELDKDILCEGMETKTYGPNTCQFISKSDNLKAMWDSRREAQA